MKPEKPAETYKEPDYKPVPSVINMPVEILLKDIENSLNKNFNGLIYEDNSFDDNGGDNLMVKAWKKDNITLQMTDNQLTYRIPLKLWIKAGFKFEQFGIAYSNYKEIEAEIALKFTTKFSINPNWTISSTTTSNGYEWLSKPVLKLGPVDLPLTSIADMILTTNQQKISTIIDKQINSAVNLKTYAADAWSYMQKPIKLSDTYNFWMRLSPKEVFTEPILAKNGKIDFRFGIKTITEAFISKESPAVTNQPLPDLKIANKLDDSFLVNLGVDLPYSMADEMAKKELINQTFGEGKRTITIKGIDVYGATDTLIIHTVVEGSIKGDIYLKGKPVYNAQTQNIEFAQLDYEIKTKNALLKTAGWLYHSGFAKMLQDKMKFSIADYLTEYKKTVQQSMTNNSVTNNIVLNGNVGNLTISNIYLTPQSMKIYLFLNGKMQVTVKGF